jgi:hypothetical protein
MLLPIGLIAIQVACIVDVVRRGRSSIWIMALLFLPVASAIAYLIVEVSPRLQYNRHVRSAREQIVNTLAPDRELNAARDALDLAPTVANRIRLGDALMALGRPGEAIPQFRDAAGAGRIDHRLGEKLARAYYLADQPGDALATLDAMTPPRASGDRDTVDLLRARIFEDLKRDDEAAALYAGLVARYPGDEVRCRYAGLLIRQGRDADAHRLLSEVESRLKRMSRHQRGADTAMYDWAMAELAKLRG